MTSLNDLKRKMKITEARPRQNDVTAVATCWPTE